MLFLIKTILIIIAIIILIISIKIQIKIKRLEYNSQKTNYKTTLGKTEKSHINPNYQITFLIYVLKYIPILKVNLTKKRIEKIGKRTYIKQRIEKIKEEDLIEIKEKYDILQEIKELLQKARINIEELNLKIKVGTENAVLTAMLIPIISTIISILITKNKIKWNKRTFQVIPIYQNKNLINLELEGIFELKVIHIINTICILKKKRRVDKNERTSNRRAYDYSYE